MLSWLRLKAQIIKELLCTLRDPKSRAIIIIAPILQLFIFSHAATLEVRNINIAVINYSQSSTAINFLQQLQQSSLVDNIIYLKNTQEVNQLIDNKTIIAALIIPNNFAQDSAQHQAKIQAILDGRRANTAQITLGYLQQIAQLTQVNILSPNTIPNPTNTIHWFNPNLTYQWFIVPSLTGVLLTFISLLLTSLSIAREREFGTFDQLLVSPCTPLEIIIAKSTPAFVVGFILTTFMTLSTIFIFRIQLYGSIGVLFSSLFLFVLSTVGIGLMLSAISSTQQQAILSTFAISVPLVLTAGFATPVENMPTVLQWLSFFNPLKHLLIIIQGLYLKGMSASQVAEHAWPLVLIALLTLSLATYLVRSKLN